MGKEADTTTVPDLSRCPRRHAAGRLLKSVIVQCPGCDFLRIGGRTDEETVDAFRRGRAFFDSIRRRLLAVVVFFALLYFGGWVLREPASPAIGGILIITFVAFAAAEAHREVWRPSRRWRGKRAPTSTRPAPRAPTDPPV